MGAAYSAERRNGVPVSLTRIRFHQTAKPVQKSIAGRRPRITQRMRMPRPPKRPKCQSIRSNRMPSPGRRKSIGSSSKVFEFAPKYDGAPGKADHENVKAGRDPHPQMNQVQCAAKRDILRLIQPRSPTGSRHGRFAFAVTPQARDEGSEWSPSIPVERPGAWRAAFAIWSWAIPRDRRRDCAAAMSPCRSLTRKPRRRRPRRSCEDRPDDCFVPERFRGRRLRRR